MVSSMNLSVCPCSLADIGLKETLPVLLSMAPATTVWLPYFFLPMKASSTSTMPESLMFSFGIRFENFLYQRLMVISGSLRTFDVWLMLSFPRKHSNICQSLLKGSFEPLNIVQDFRENLSLHFPQKYLPETLELYLLLHLGQRIWLLKSFCLS